MKIIVSNDKRVPLDITDKDYEIWSLDEFIKAINSDDGLTLDGDKVYFNIEVLTNELYQDLSAFGEYIVFYHFNTNDFRLSFNIEQEIVEYEVKEDVLDELEEEIEDDEIEEVEEEVEEEIESLIIEKPVEKPKEETKDDIINVSDISYEGQLVDIANLMEEREVLTQDSSKPAKVYVFGSLKGGSGKSTTCIMAVHNYAKKNPHLKIALCDLDLSDGQVSSLIIKSNPTLAHYYREYENGSIGTTDIEKSTVLQRYCVKAEKFSSNLDIYLAPNIEVKEVTGNREFWNLVLEQLVKTYDVVFFDTGTEYLSKPVITSAYKIADRVVLLTNTSTTSVRSVHRQLKVLGGITENEYFDASESILDRTRVVITRASKNKEVMNIIAKYIQPYAKIVTAFGNIEDLIEGIQWFHKFDLIYDYPQVVTALDKITDI